MASLMYPLFDNLKSTIYLQNLLLVDRHGFHHSFDLRMLKPKTCRNLFCDFIFKYIDKFKFYQINSMTS